MTSDPIHCPRCGQPHPRCTGHNRDGDPCGMWPRRGATVCKRHGGHAPQVAAAAERRRREEAAAEAVATFGAPREIAPDMALLEEVHRTAGHVAWLGQVVAGLEEGEVVWGLVEETDAPPTDNGGGGLTTKRRAAVNVWVQLYQAERKHLAAVSKAALDAGVSERLVNVFEQVGGAYVQMMGRVFDALELSEEQRARVPQVVEAELRAIAGRVA